MPSLLLPSLASSFLISGLLHLSFRIPLTTSLVPSFFASLILCIAGELLAKVPRRDIVADSKTTTNVPAIENTNTDDHDETFLALKEDPNYDHATGLLTLATRRPSSLLIVSTNSLPAPVAVTDGPGEAAADVHPEHPENRPRSHTYTPLHSTKIDDDSEAENSTHRPRRHTTTSLLPSVLDELRSKFNRRQQQSSSSTSPSSSTVPSRSPSPVPFADDNNDLERPELVHHDSADFRPTVYQERHGITCAPIWWKKTQRKVSKACKLIAGTDDPTEAWDRLSNAIDRKAQHAVERVKDHLHRDDSQSHQSIPAPAPNDSATDKIELRRSMSRSSITSSESSMSDEHASMAPSSGKTRRLVAKIAEKARSHKSGTWGKRRGAAE